MRPLCKCSPRGYGMCRCQYNVLPARRFLRRMVRSISNADIVHNSRRLCLSRSQSSSHRRNKRMDLDLSHDPRIRRHRTRTCNEHLFNHRLLLNNNVYYPLPRRRPASMQARVHSRLHPNRKCTLRSSYLEPLRPTSLHQQSVHMFLKRPFLLNSPTCFLRQRTNTLLPHGVWDHFWGAKERKLMSDNTTNLYLLLWGVWMLC